MPTRTQLISAYVMAFFYFSAGLMHFINPSFFEQIVPGVLPFPLLIVYLSGAAELALGAGLVLPKTRHWAAWGVVALLVAVYPANLYHWVADVKVDDVQVPAIYHPIRALVQVLLIAWAAWLARSTRPGLTRRLTSS
ncbi:MAG: DoxX family protein [Polyangiaceae bacterium]